MIAPPYLKSKDTIGITATASYISKKDIQRSIQIIENWGFKTIISNIIGKQFHQFAGTDEDRLTEFQKMLDNPEIRAIFCARGGYGTVRIIDNIDFSKFIKQPKWIVGFSDITVLHSHINTVYGIQTIHGPMPKTFPKDQISNDFLRDALKGKLRHYSIKSHKINILGKSEGLLTGGNLSIIHTLIGSSSDFNPGNKILVIEDVGEYLYNIDRMLWGLRRAKDISTLAGVIVGNISDTKDNETPFGKTAMEIIHEHFSSYNIPICFNFPTGHDSVNYPLYLGKHMEMEVQKDEVLLKFE